MIKNVVFDIGRVLLDYDPESWLRSLFTEETAALILRELFRGPEWIYLDEGTMAEEEALERILRRNPAHADALRQAFYGWAPCMTPIEGMEEIVRDCKSRGFGIYALSNFGLRCREIIAPYPVFSLFDGVLVSAEEHLIKPDLRIYSRFCEKFSCEPEECFFTDDMPENISAARGAGFHAELFTGASHLQAALLREVFR